MTARLSVAFLNPYVAPDSTDEAPNRRLLFVRSIVAEGPYNPPPPPAPPHQQKLPGSRCRLAWAQIGLAGVSEDVDLGMYYAGISSNIMSLAGIAISIGVLVDGARGERGVRGIVGQVHQLAAADR